MFCIEHACLAKVSPALQLLAHLLWLQIAAPLTHDRHDSSLRIEPYPILHPAVKIGLSS